jgi:endogenous inhibitor of DNA gyrase (YacG/DUF329 family)
MKRPCPTCGRPAEQEPVNPERPFCGRRCRELDLARWLDGDYRIPVADSDEGDGGAPPAAEDEA